MNVLLIGYVWPEWGSSAAGIRDLNLIEAFQSFGWDLTVCSGAKENAYTRSVERLGAKVAHFEANDRRFDPFVRVLQPELVVFDRFITEEQFGWRVREQAPRALRIIDTQDFHALRRARRSALERGIPQERIDRAEIPFKNDDLYRELASYYRSDQVWLISDFEKNLLENKFGFPRERLELYRFFYPLVQRTKPFEERRDFVFLGGFRHPPNEDAVLYLKKEIWPRIRLRLPGAKIDVYGSYPPKQIMGLNDERSGFCVKGPCKDQFETLSRYRVNLAPVRFGAGIKGKISDGWRMGTPVVTTPIGIEGMTQDLAPGGLIASDPKEFANLSVKLHEDAPVWNSHSLQALELIRTLYNEERERVRLKTSLETLDRKKNWIGEILWHQSHRSTEYFSKWIEEKNQNPLN